MPQPTTDRNLLFGILAMQLDIITREQLLAAMQAWVFDKAKSLGEILQTQKALDQDNRQLLDTFVLKHLAKHDNNSEKSLAAISSVGNVRKELERITDPDLQASLVHVAAARPKEQDPWATVAPTPVLLAKELERITDPDLQASLVHGAVARPKEQDPWATVAPTPALLAAAGMRFRIVRPHARGGLGEVFVALDEELHREVALKEIQEAHADNPESRTRFLLEAKITGGLEHPGIVPVYGLGTYADGRPYYAMRFIRGDNLKDAIERFHRADKAGIEPGERALAVRGLLRRFVDVCDAIAYAHSRGVLHRDLKPANIMLGKYGETLVVDWGLAKPLGAPAKGTEPTEPGEGLLMPTWKNSASQTLAGSTVGTPQYMSPEQAGGRLELLGPASDVYSLGATLFCILTGQSPFNETNVGTVLQLVQRGDFPKAREIKASIPASLEAVCMKAMALKPDDRYQSPRGLADDIEHWLADEPTSAWKEPFSVKAKRWMNRHTALVTGVASAVIIALVSLVLATVLLTAANERERQTKEYAQEQEREAVKQKNLAVENFKKADANFKLARSAVDSYHTHVSQEVLLDREGMHALRKKLLEAAQEFYKKFVEERGNDPAMRGELGKATFRLAQITGDIGTKDAAIKLHEDAAKIFEALPTDKTAVDFQADQAAGYHHLGRLNRLVDKNDKSEEWYRKALTLWEQLVKDHGQENVYHAGLARTQMGLGNLEQNKKKDSVLAQQYYQKALAGWQKLADAHGDVPAYRRDMATCQSNIGLLLSGAGKEKDAETAFRAAIAVQKKLTDDAPNISQYQDDLGRSYFNLGDYLWKTAGPKSDAEACYHDAVNRWKSVSDRYPDETILQVHLAFGYVALSNVYRLKPDFAEAEDYCYKALAIRRRLAEANKADPVRQSDLANSYYALGEVCRSSLKTDKAAESYETAAPIQHKLARENPKAPHYRSQLARTYDRLGFMYALAKKKVEAEGEYKKALDVWNQLTRDHADELEYAVGLSTTYLNRGDLAKAGKDLKDAVEWYKRGGACLAKFQQPDSKVLKEARKNAEQALAEARKEAGKP
ncbi:MAG: serine/threonine-protein kinase [Gemmataceae bacterium]|nr:serine/threonine-protein kinase [Gemmataceae bacterium]